MRPRGLGWRLQEKNHQGLMLEGHRNKNRSWVSSPRPSSLPPSFLSSVVLKTKQNKTITLCVCTCTCMFCCIYVGYQRTACRSGFSSIMFILRIQLQAWGQVPLPSQPSCQPLLCYLLLPPFQHLVGEKNHIWPERYILRVCLYMK